MDIPMKNVVIKRSIIKEVILSCISVYALLLTIITLLIFNHILIMPKLCNYNTQQIIGN